MFEHDFFNLENMITDKNKEEKIKSNNCCVVLNEWYCKVCTFIKKCEGYMG